MGQYLTSNFKTDAKEIIFLQAVAFAIVLYI